MSRSRIAKLCIRADIVAPIPTTVKKKKSGTFSHNFALMTFYMFTNSTFFTAEMFTPQAVLFN